MEKIILHCDLNNFYASCECIDHPELKNYPMAVCGSAEDRHGIVLAKNELAKKAGVKTAEVIWQAKAKCPDLIIVPPHMDKYIEISKRVRKIYSQYTDLVEPFGIDECWLDVTGSKLLFGSGYEIANKIREQVKAQENLTISVGISFTKIFAKLGSDLKKPDAVTCITKDNYKQKVWPLKANELLGIGKSTYEKLQKYGINTIGDIACADLDFLKKILGKSGEALWHFSNGIGDDQIAHQNDYSIPKSIGHSNTCPKDLTDNQAVWLVLYHLCESVAKRLREQSMLATGIRITIKDCDLSVKEYQSPLSFATRYPKDLADLGILLFKKNYSWSKPVRMVGITAIQLIPDTEAIQLSFLQNQEKMKEHEILEEKVQSLRKRFGEQAVLRASLLNINKPSKELKKDIDTLPSQFQKYNK